MNELLDWSSATGQPLWQKVEDCEGPTIWDYLRSIWRSMQETIQRGLQNEAALPGRFHLQRKAARAYRRARSLSREQARTINVSAYALACSEENAAGGIVVTAPTCGACGVLPAVLYHLSKRERMDEVVVLRALATAGLVGNVVKQNASISGAEVGCQGEIGVACSMAAAAMAQVLGGSPPQIEYAAEMGLEHHLGLTCDPVDGLVQIPCIERNVMAALRAIHCAEYAMLSDGRHYVSFDQVVKTMLLTGKDLPSIYRETSLGGLAIQFPNAPHDS
jgi:L-serine dehydratase